MQMDAEAQALFQQMEAERQALATSNTNSQNNYSQLSMYQGINPSNLAELQLDLSREKALIDHILRAHVFKRDGNKEYWDTADDPTRKIFTDYGVDRLMNFINIYVSLNIILSYYLPEEVKQKMLIISNELADIFYMEYEYLFYKPSLKELSDYYKINASYIEELSDKEIIELHAKLKKDSEVIYQKNCKQVYMIHNMLINAVHSAYNRALWGKERDSLRKMMHISETSGINNGLGNKGLPQNTMGTKFKWYNPNTW